MFSLQSHTCLCSYILVTVFKSEHTTLVPQTYLNRGAKGWLINTIKNMWEGTCDRWILPRLECQHSWSQFELDILLLKWEVGVYQHKHMSLASQRILNVVYYYLTFFGWSIISSHSSCIRMLPWEVRSLWQNICWNVVRRGVTKRLKSMGQIKYPLLYSILARAPF